MLGPLNSRSLAAKFLSTGCLLAMFCTLVVWEEVRCFADPSGSMPVSRSVGPKAMPVEIAPYDPPFEMPRLERPKFPDRKIDISERGAVSGSERLITGTIQDSIDEISAAGGGTVVVPAGEWKTGRIVLKSNVCLHVERGAELHFSGRIEDYLPVVMSRSEGIEIMGLGGLIYAHRQQNIAITGQGELIGPETGPVRKQFKGLVEEVVDQSLPVEQRVFDGRKGGHFFRPYFISPVDCKNVYLEGVSLSKGPMWNIVPIYCDGVVVRGVTIDSRGVVNGDGVNIESSRNVLVEYCSARTGDDCFALKAGRNADGLRTARPVQNVVIRHNYAQSGFGGITFGSETAGTIRNIHVHDCVFENVRHAAYFKTRRPRGGGGQNILVERIAFQSSNHAVFFDMLGLPIYVGELANRLPARPLTEQTPFYREITLRELRGTSGRDALKIYGIPESPATGIVFEDCQIRSQGLINLSDTTEVRIKNSVFQCKTPEIEILDVIDLSLTNVKIESDSTDWKLTVRGPKTEHVTLENCEPALQDFQLTLAEDVQIDAIQATH